jgi:hypothetical protein
VSHYNSDKNEIIHWPTRDSEVYPGWEMIDCGCCHGIEWGGEESRECKECCASGIQWRHKKSGVYAEYPGGPFTGRDSKS